MYITRSNDGNTWQNTEKIGGVEGGSPTLFVFKDKLWVIWHGVFESQLWIAEASDGLTWSGIKKIEGQEAWKTSVTVYEDRLIMVYTHTLSHQLWMSESVDGYNWTNTRKIEGLLSSEASVVTFKDKVVMVYSHPAIDDYHLFVTFYDSKHGWSDPKQIEGQETSVPVLTTIGEWIFMTYSDPKLSSRFWATRSLDGIHWQDTMEIPGQHGDVPSLAVYENIVYMAYRIDRNLWSTSCENGDLTLHEPIHNPTQEDLGKYSNESYYVDINESQFPGQPIPDAPMYYAVQEQGDTVTIHYPILYADQSGQTCRALRVESEFDCALQTLGYHQGDLERYNITLKRNGDSFTIVQAGFEAHGDLITYPPNQVTWEEETHAVVHVYLPFLVHTDLCFQVALNGHASRNRDPKQGPLVIVAVPGIVAIGDFLGNGPVWRPYAQGSTFTLLGLDKQGHPVNDQKWAVFKGHLGKLYATKLTGATYFNGKKLDDIDWDYVKTVFGVAEVLDLVASSFFVAGSPTGPNAWNRDWVTNSANTS